MRVVMSGYYGFDNVGDEAILFSIIQALRDADPDIGITVLSNNPEYTMGTYQVDAVNRWDMKEVSQTIKQADGLISGGGSLLQDKTGWKSVPYYTGIMRIANWHHTPVFVYAQGIGPIQRTLNKWIVKSTMNKAGKITVRDEGSKTLLETIGVKRPIELVPDPVLALDGSSFTDRWLSKQGISGKTVAVSVRDWPTDQPYKARIAAGLDSLAEAGYSIVFVPMHGDHDLKASEETTELMQAPSHISPKDAAIEEKIAVIGEADLLIGMRLHSLIFAAVTSTPFVALSYDPKIDSFASICEQQVAGHVDHGDWDGHSLFNLAERSLDNLRSEQEFLKTKVQKYQQQARNIPHAAIKLFSNTE